MSDEYVGRPARLGPTIPGIGVILLCTGFNVMAQSPAPFENLSIDRPDVSNLPTTVRPGHFQFELGSERGHGQLVREFHVPNMVFRTGLNRKSELRIGYDYIKLDSLGNGMNDGLMLATLGGKYRFVEERGARPSVALQGEFALPFGSGADFNYDHVDYTLAAWSLLLLLNNTVHEQVFINYNAGAFWSRADRMDFLVSVSTSLIHTHRLAYFVEVYALIDLDHAPISFDGGLMFLVSPRFQVDLYGGQRAFETERLWLYGAGIGFRLDRGDLKPRTFSEIGIHH
jgi:hypothetical protein